MTSWYHALCDKHKEMCSLFVAHSNRIAEVFPEDAQAAAIQFLSDHWTCELRLLRDDLGDYRRADYVDKTPP